MNRFKVWLRVTGHSVALLVLIAVGSMTPATAIGTDQEFQDAEKFCSSIDGIRKDVSKSLSAAQSDQRSTWRIQSEHMNLMKRQFATDVMALQNEIDSAHQKNIDAMGIAYSTQENLKAIDEYAHSAKQIAQERRATVQQAQDEFAASASEMLAGRQAVRAGQTEAFRIAVDDALRAATVTCQDDPEDINVQTILSQQLKKAREVFMKNQQTDESAKGKLVALETKRNVIISTANLHSAQKLVVLSGSIASLRN